MFKQPHGIHTQRLMKTGQILENRKQNNKSSLTNLVTRGRFGNKLKQYIYNRLKYTFCQLTFKNILNLK